MRERDPDNRWLAYFPRQRLTGEELRDSALFVSGLLSTAMGGPPVYPYQPDGLWEERANEASNTRVYKRSDGDSLYRKSVYTFWKRTCPPPLMAVFDAPDRTTCVVRRNPTNTPLQALATLNDEQFLECAKMLAVRTLTEKPEFLNTQERLTQMARRVTGKTPSDADLDSMQKTLQIFRTRFQGQVGDANSLLQVGVAAIPADLDQREVAAWMLVANAMLNFDQTLVRD